MSWSDYYQIASGYIQQASGYIQQASGYIQQAKEKLTETPIYKKLPEESFHIRNPLLTAIFFATLKYEVEPNKVHFDHNCLGSDVGLSGSITRTYRYWFDPRSGASKDCLEKLKTDLKQARVWYVTEENREDIETIFKATIEGLNNLDYEGLVISFRERCEQILFKADDRETAYESIPDVSLIDFIVAIQNILTKMRNVSDAHRFHDDSCDMKGLISLIKKIKPKTDFPIKIVDENLLLRIKNLVDYEFIMLLNDMVLQIKNVKDFSPFLYNCTTRKIPSSYKGKERVDSDNEQNFTEEDQSFTDEDIKLCKRILTFSSKLYQHNRKQDLIERVKSIIDNTDIRQIANYFREADKVQVKGKKSKSRPPHLIIESINQLIKRKVTLLQLELAKHYDAYPIPTE